MPVSADLGHSLVARIVTLFVILDPFYHKLTGDIAPAQKRDVA